MPKLLQAIRLSTAIDIPLRTRWLWLKAGSILLSTVLLAAIWIFTLTRLAQERELVIDHASVTQKNLAQVIAESLRQVVDRGAQYALTIGAVAVPCAPSRSQLSSLLIGERAYNRAALFDRNGHKIYSSSPGSIPATLAAKLEDLIVSEDREATAPIVVGPLSRTYGESWQVPLLLPVRNPSGEFCSVLMLHLDMGYLLRLYQDIEIGRTGVIQILQTDGTELARARNSGLEIGAADNIASPLMSGILQERTRIVPLLNDGQTRLVSLKEVEGYPIVVTVSKELGDVLNEFESRRNKYLVSLFMLTVVVLAMTTLVVAVIRQQRRYVDAIEHSESDKQDLIDQLEAEKLHAYELASSDQLTGLANRRLFLSLASSHLARAQRSREHYALMFLDLDRFKAINDNLGHRVGDLLLQRVSQKLRDCLRKSDVIARFGGDEFIVLITGVEREEDIVAIATKLVTSVAEPCDLDGHDVQVGPSIGVAIFPRDGQDLDSLIRHADMAMYQSKRAGRGCFTFFDSAMNVAAVSDFELEQRLPRSIDAGDFVLHFQPKLNLQNNVITGFEALVRWQHPEHGMIYPNDFIPMAESTGHIVKLGDWVIDEACRQLAAWRDEGLAPLTVAINLSARQLHDKSLADRIVARLAEHRLDPRLLQVEVTESSLIECIEEARSLFDRLVAAGIEVALDDFGSGFSSLGYIKTLPIGVIKIDRGFIRDILNSHDDAVIVLSTITLAHNLGLRVVAEGVESRAQLIHLKTGGCDEIQGYYLGRPVPAAQAREFIENPERNLT